MTDSDRRSFLRNVATTAGAAAAYAAFPPAIARALATRAFNETGTINDVKHVVILMLENRSFDHYFGTMRGVRGFGDRFPVPLASGKPVWNQSDGTKEIPPYHLDSTTSNALLVPDTPHSYADMQLAWNQGKYGFWPKYKTPYSMGHYQRADIPFQFALAEAFTICDAYHCSITSGTDPNRIVFFSGSNFNPALRAQGINCQADQSEPNNLRCWVNGTMPVPGYTYDKIAPNAPLSWLTIPDVLQQAGVTWRIYQDPNDNWTGAMHGGLAFQTFRDAQPGSPLYVNGMSDWSLADLTSHVMNDTLPQVNWVLPSQSTSEHPGAPCSPTHGGDYTSQVLDALTANPAVWSKTVLFLTFDENDGFFDHLPAPALPSYNADGTLAGKSTVPLAGEYFYDPNRAIISASDTISGTTRPWGLGPRVPMYVISPWSKGGWVNSQVFDHTSVGMFLEKRFGITIDAISPWHRAVAGDLTSAFDFVSPNDPSFPALPDQSNWSAVETQQKSLPAPVPPTTAQPLFQETGVRYSRALPYELHVHGRVVPDLNLGTPNAVALAFVNTGKKAAVFHVYDRLNLEAIPRRYTVEPQRQLNDAWAPAADGRYDLWVLGPNGFHRQVSGNTRRLAGGTRAHPEALVRYDPANAQLVILLTNSGGAPCSFSITANAYGPAAALAATVVARSETRLVWPVAQSNRWYDFSVKVDGNTEFMRRFAGRMETGQPSVSDPAMAAAL